jgi:hypothetical protein
VNGASQTFGEVAERMVRAAGSPQGVAFQISVNGGRVADTELFHADPGSSVCVELRTPTIMLSLRQHCLRACRWFASGIPKGVVTLG